MKISLVKISWVKLLWINPSRITLLWMNMLMLFYMIGIGGFASPAIAAHVHDVKVSMRDSGYTMGDFIDMEVRIRLDKNETLNHDSLPLEGRVTPWLDLHKLTVQETKNSLQLNLRWQIFATVEIAQPLKIPAISLKTIRPSALMHAESKHAKQHRPDAATIVIPAQSLHYSPVLAYPLNTMQRKPDLPPFRFNTRTPLIYLTLCLSSALLLSLLWLWLKDLIPWLPYRAGPMTQLARTLKSCNASYFTVAQLRVIHAALNSAANQSLYPETLSKLFDKARYLSPHQAAISAFFHDSWAVFYQESPKQVPVASTLAWVREAALAERLFRRNIANGAMVSA